MTELIVPTVGMPTARLAGEAPCTHRWIVEGDRVLGGIALRHATAHSRGDPAHQARLGAALLWINLGEPRT